MSRTLIFLIAIFALWMYFSFGNFEGNKKLAEKYTVKDYDKAQSGRAGVRV